MRGTQIPQLGEAPILGKGEASRNAASQIALCLWKTGETFTARKRNKASHFNQGRNPKRKNQRNPSHARNGTRGVKVAL